MFVYGNQKRSGAAIVELAACLPIIFALLFGSIEACNMIALKQIVAQSVYDGALAAVKPGASESAIVANINTMLAARNVSPSSVSVEGESGGAYDSLGHGDLVVVTIEVLTDNNVVGPQLFGFGRTLSSSSTAVKQ